MDLQDQRLVAKLSAGDMVAQEAKYHAPCLASLFMYNKATAFQVQADDDDDTKVSHGIALAELLSYINEARLDDKNKTVFKLADLAKLYSARLEQLGTENNARIHSTGLKNRILSHIPDLNEHTEGRDVLLKLNSLRTGSNFSVLTQTKQSCLRSWQNTFSSLQTDKQVVTTYGAQVLSIPSRATSLLALCSHEEADTRMILHLADAVNQKAFRRFSSGELTQML